MVWIFTIAHGLIRWHICNMSQSQIATRKSGNQVHRVLQKSSESPRSQNQILYHIG